MIVKFSGSSDTTLNNKSYTMHNLKSVRDVFIQIHKDITVEFTNADGSIKDGVLCLLDDSDWELTNCYESDIKNVHTITLINTIHGG
ncbi:ubiquitin-related modifier 1 [Vairimorpha ceranae]|uniref:Ubiquitin-related modifier 1 n=1 Tax=Vairimorpha ceranae TaxID=40302 RepID=A0A0F9YV28_9MICR|nr:ubiquitin-related modifier 1 [Vairimorpha ceranae]KAF5140822.1 hypothetical protein G9O61_00g010530 [Vairimorpha ceranae]KKO76312.1 ubiquitin-related modifier 1 [Vairimorpha ceranae]